MSKSKQEEKTIRFHQLITSTFTLFIVSLRSIIANLLFNHISNILYLNEMYQIQTNCRLLQLSHFQSFFKFKPQVKCYQFFVFSIYLIIHISFININSQFILMLISIILMTYLQQWQQTTKINNIEVLENPQDMPQREPISKTKTEVDNKTFNTKAKKSLQNFFTKQRLLNQERNENNSLNDLKSCKKKRNTPESLPQSYNQIQTSAVFIDENCEPEQFNRFFCTLVGTKDKQIIKNILSSIAVTELDKQTKQNLKLKKSEYSNQYSQRRLLISFGEIIKNQRFISKAVITEFHSEYIRGSYQINIFPLNRQYLVVFTNVEEFESLLIKRTTDTLMHQIFRSFSHEFSTSLNAIQTIGQAAQNDQRLVHICQVFINPILSSASILKSILSDIKDFSMILSKNFLVHIDSINLIQTIESVYQNFSSQMEMKGIEFQLVGENLTLESDSQRISQILNNLISNAQKFTEKGLIRIEFKEEFFNDTRYIEICIEDTGSGMDSSEVIRLDKFLSNDLSKRKDKGLNSFGIGLLISNEISLQLSKLKRQQGGGIHFETILGKGSKFWFRVMDIKSTTFRSKKQQSMHTNRLFKAVSLKGEELRNSFFNKNPIFSIKLKKAQEEQLKSGRSSSEFSLNSNSERKEIQLCQIQDHFIMKHPEHFEQNEQCECARILIVDDEFINIYALRLLLKTFGLKGDSASNGYEGANKVIHRYEHPCLKCRSVYDHIIMDIEMPIWNGLKAAEAIKQYCWQKQFDVPNIIACTAYVDQNTQQQCLDSGMSFFIPKPIAKIDLQQALQIIID